MKYLLCLCLLFAFPSYAQTRPANSPLVRGVTALDAKNGFRNYRFGVPIESIKGLRPVSYPQFSGGVFERANEPMGVGPVHLTSLYFASSKGRLAAFILACYGSVNAGNLLAVLQQQYGAGLEYPGQHFNWPGKRVTMDYTLDGEQCVVTIVSNAGAKANAGLADDSAIKKGTKDL